MRVTKVRVQNFRNIEDSGWVPFDKVTALVGRNESGKTALLKAVHKFNPGTPEPYDPQREYPRDRYTRDFVAAGEMGEDWPVCSIEFEVSGKVRDGILEVLPDGQAPPARVTGTRYYDGHIDLSYEPALPTDHVPSDPIKDALDAFAAGARRLEVAEGEPEETTAARRTKLAQWANRWTETLKGITEMRSVEGTQYLTDLLNEVETKSDPATADLVEELRDAVRPVLDEAEEESLVEQVDEIVQSSLPVFIYFEDYGILDSAIWLPRFVEDLEGNPAEPRVRTVNAMFKHVGLDPREIAELGTPLTTQMRARGERPTPEQEAADERLVEQRAILLNAASNDISEKFSDWWSQRRHKIRYHADGEHFRIWVADELRPGIEIELESRSKGFQWFFSFYLVFLVESEAGHKDAVLLLDEPGLHLHPTAQQELIDFFETLSETNQVAYTTHSPFLIDGERLHRVRPVTEDESGHSRISQDEWPEDRETIFPLQAAAGYAMIRGLFAHRKNVLVEGMSDFYYLHVLSRQCANSGRAALPADIYITPCGGTRYVGRMASLFLGHEVSPLILLDGDEAVRVRKNALLQELYASHDPGILMLDDALQRSGSEVEIEDLLDEAVVLAAVEASCGIALTLDDDGESAASLPSRIESAAEAQGADLPTAWKTVVALHLVSSWAEEGTTLPAKTLDRAASLFADINRRFDEDLL